MSERVVGASIDSNSDAAGATFVNSASDQRVVNNVMRHEYRVLSEEEKRAMVQIKDAGLFVIKLIDNCVPAGRENSLAKTKVEEAIMWAVKGLTA